jgi:hypothetical protein
MKIKKTTTYNTDGGEHRSIVREAFELPDGTVRIVFQIISTTHPLFIYLAGKNYKKEDDFTGDLIKWLGVDKVQEMVAEDGTIDLEMLKGLEADICIELISNDAYEHPFAFVRAIAAPGTFYFGPEEKAA